MGNRETEQSNCIFIYTCTPVRGLGRGFTSCFNAGWVPILQRCNEHLIVLQVIVFGVAFCLQWDQHLASRLALPNVFECKLWHLLQHILATGPDTVIVPLDFPLGARLPLGLMRPRVQEHVYVQGRAVNNTHKLKISSLANKLL